MFGVVQVRLHSYLQFQGFPQVEMSFRSLHVIATVVSQEVSNMMNEFNTFVFNYSTTNCFSK